jgi:hypothetical protein
MGLAAGAGAVLGSNVIVRAMRLVTQNIALFPPGWAITELSGEI